MDILSEIVQKKQERVAAARKVVLLEDLISEAKSQRTSAESHFLKRVLSRDGINIIAEFKRRSPSKGVIRDDATPIEMAHSYRAGGAVAMSILTEADYFDGSLDDLRSVKVGISDIALLRKDFIFDEYQVYESAAAGADAVLLIVAVLDDATLVRLRRLVEDDLGMDALVEVHSEHEMKRALNAGATLIGVNNRDLRTFTVSLDTSMALAGQVSGDTILVSESGLKCAADLRLLQSAGYKGFLVGESLMRASDPEAAVRSFIES
jgi:indole-3-glycerol phosphate synthase